MAALSPLGRSIKRAPRLPPWARSTDVSPPGCFRSNRRSFSDALPRGRCTDLLCPEGSTVLGSIWNAVSLRIASHFSKSVWVAKAEQVSDRAYFIEGDRTSHRPAMVSSIGISGRMKCGSHAMMLSCGARARFGSSWACCKVPPSGASTTRIEARHDVNGFAMGASCPFHATGLANAVYALPPSCLGEGSPFRGMMCNGSRFP